MAWENMPRTSPSPESLVFRVPVVRCYIYLVGLLAQKAPRKDTPDSPNYAGTSRTGVRLHESVGSGVEIFASSLASHEVSLRTHAGHREGPEPCGGPRNARRCRTTAGNCTGPIGGSTRGIGSCLRSEARHKETKEGLSRAHSVLRMCKRASLG